MADYQWKWVRGQDLTVKMDMVSVAATNTFVPVGLTSNLMVEPQASGAAIFGVLKNKAAANAYATDDDAPVVIVSNDIFEVRCLGNLGLGETVTCMSDNSVQTYTSGTLSCGVVVDYNPSASVSTTKALCHIMAHFYPHNHTGTLA